MLLSRSHSVISKVINFVRYKYQYWGRKLIRSGGACHRLVGEGEILVAPGRMLNDQQSKCEAQEKILESKGRIRAWGKNFLGSGNNFRSNRKWMRGSGMNLRDYGINIETQERLIKAQGKKDWDDCCRLCCSSHLILINILRKYCLYYYLRVPSFLVEISFNIVR